MDTSQFKTVGELLEDPARWTQGYFAKDKNGRELSTSDPDATCWCLVGAVNRIYGDNSYGDNSRFVAIYEKLVAIVEQEKHVFISFFNDDPATTHAEVMRIVRLAGI